MADVDDYIEEIETDGIYWEDGYYDPSDWENVNRGWPEDSGEGEEWGGEEWGSDVPTSKYPEADWRGELRTAEAKRDYLERVLGVKPGDASYKNDFRYLGLIASGQRNPTGDKWTKVVHTAQINAAQQNKYREPDRPGPKKRTAPKTFHAGDYITGSARWTMAEKGGRVARSWDGGVILDARTAAIANSGDIPRAFVAAYLNGRLA